MKKIIFLIKNKSKINIIMIFLIQKFFNIFIKKKIKSFKKRNQIFLKNKRITNDYFSMHSYNFFKYLNFLEGNFNYLEIGTYEGNSAMFVANTFPKSKVYCVDNWNKTEEYGDQNFDIVEKNFDYNTSSFNNILKFKNNSDDFFKKNNTLFEVIYIDGYHKDFQVLKDCRNAWKILKKNGLLICDDYIWNFYENIKENPCYSINKFIDEIKNENKVLEVSKSQIFIKKL
tara:strand:- start:985 stop:1671 length:687 start_codon:yes stop_codon:yes gene_type:complete